MSQGPAPDGPGAGASCERHAEATPSSRRAQRAQSHRVGETTREHVIDSSLPAAPFGVLRSPLGLGYQVLAVILAGWIFGAGYTLSPLIQDYSDASVTLTPIVPLALGIGAPIGVFIAVCSFGAAKLWTLIAHRIAFGFGFGFDVVRRVGYAGAAIVGTAPLFYIIVSGESGALGLLLHNVAIPILAFVSAFVAYPWFEKKAHRRRSTARRSS